MALVVYVGPSEMRLVRVLGGDYLLEQEVPQEVPQEVADELIKSNPAPWQPAYCDRYAIVDGGDD